MNKKRFSLLPMLLLLCALLVPAMAAEPTERDKIVILHTNDVHCAIDQKKDEATGAVSAIGYAGLAAYQAEIQKIYGNSKVTLVDSGDAIQGDPVATLSKGADLVDIMNELGYDFAVPGCHEFDYGMENFLTLAQDRAKFSYLCANFMDHSGTPILAPYELVSYDGVKVAYLGILTPQAISKSAPSSFQDENGKYLYGFGQSPDGKELYDIVQKAVDAARASGANYVVALGHLGLSKQAAAWSATQVLTNTSGIDVLIDGHSHDVFSKAIVNKKGKDVLVAQTGSQFQNIGKIVIDTRTGKITSEMVSNYAVQEPKIAALLQSVQDAFQAVLKQPIAKSDAALTTLNPATGQRAVRNTETNLGDLCADAYRSVLGADVAIVNGGGILADIPAGDITFEEIIAVHPFGKAACVVETSGQKILNALEMGVRSIPTESSSFLHVSGLRYTVDASLPSSVVVNDKKEFVSVNGPYRVKDVMVGKQPLNPSQKYTLAACDYLLQDGGDGLVMFKADKLLLDDVMSDNQILSRYIVDILDGVVGAGYSKPAGQGRIQVKYIGLDAGAWYSEAAKYVMDAGIMIGTNKGFDADSLVTRATVCQILYNMAENPAIDPQTPSFANIDGQWYESAARWAAATGLLDSGSPFDGTAIITRAETAQLLAQYATTIGITVEQEGMALREAPDYDSIPAQTLPGMSFCYHAGLMQGDQNKNLNPLGPLSRAEMAQLLLNFSKLNAPTAQNS